MAIDHSKLKAWALCWPEDPRVLLFDSERLAEENRAWFSKNYKTTPQGTQRGDPFVLNLSVTASLTNTEQDLIKALEHIEQVAMAGEPRDLPGIVQTARKAIAKARR